MIPHVNETVDTQRLPNRDDFIAFWQDCHTFKFRKLAPLGIYLGGLALYAIVIRMIDTTGHFAIPAFAGAIAFVILLPVIYVGIYWKRYDRFIRCPRCRDWVGRDSRGAWRGPNPKWIAIRQTGRCGICGAQIFTSEHQSSEHAG